MGKWAIAYADQAEQDHAALKVEVRASIIDVELEHWVICSISCRSERTENNA
jgi:hypothetical protein